MSLLRLLGFEIAGIFLSQRTIDSIAARYDSLGEGLRALSAVAYLSASKAGTFAIKQGAAGCLCSHNGIMSKLVATTVQAVTDTTAAGDAFNAGFLAGWLAGLDPTDCCVAGNNLADAVIQHRGAIIASSATPSMSALARGVPQAY